MLMSIISKIMAAIRLVASIGAMAAFYLLFEILRPFKKDKFAWGLRIQHLYTRACLFIFGVKHSVTGKAYEGNALYVGNHRSLIDPVLMRRYITALGVSKAEVASYPIMGRAVGRTGAVFVNRSDRNSRAKTKSEIVQALKDGHSVFLFPEGHVSDEKTTLPFKKGSFEKAAEAGVPVVPVTFLFNDPKYHWVNIGTLAYYFKSFGWCTPNVDVIIGEPIFSTDGMELLEKSQAVINHNLLTIKPPK